MAIFRVWSARKRWDMKLMVCGRGLGARWGCAGGARREVVATAVNAAKGRVSAAKGRVKVKGPPGSDSSLYGGVRNDNRMALGLSERNALSILTVYCVYDGAAVRPQPVAGKR